MSKIGRLRGPSHVLTPAAAEVAPPAAVAPSKPNKTAPVADWRAYAEALGEDATGTKSELIARVG